MTRVMMERCRHRIGAAGLLIVLALALTGCHTARGGGSLPPGDAIAGEFVAAGETARQQAEARFDARATFGFNFTCENRNGTAIIRGQLDYYDHGTTTITLLGATTADVDDTKLEPFVDVALHGEIEPRLFQNTACESIDLELDVAKFHGFYRPQHSDPNFLGTEEGTFTVNVFDQGEGLASNRDASGDAFSIELVGGRYSGYQRSGYIEGGNIQTE